MYYKVKRNLMVRREIGVYVSYGISACDERGKCIMHYPDLCTEKEKVRAFCEKLNALKPSTIHMEEIVEDFLVDCLQ